VVTFPDGARAPRSGGIRRLRQFPPISHAPRPLRFRGNWTRTSISPTEMILSDRTFGRLQAGLFGGLVIGPENVPTPARMLRPMKPDDPTPEECCDELGLVSRSQLHAKGFTDGQIDNWVARGRLRRWMRNVYGLPGWPQTFEARCRAAQLCRPGSIVIGLSAAYLHGLRGCMEPAEPTVWCPGSRAPRVAGTIWSVGKMPSASMRRGVLNVASVADALARMGADAQRDLVENAVEDALHRQLTSIVELHRVVDERAGCSGTHRLRAVLSLRADEPPCQSGFEVRFMQMMRSKHVRPLARQVPIRAAGQLIHADFEAPDAGLVIEVDHTFWHSGPTSEYRDGQRDLAYAKAGKSVVRPTEFDLAGRSPDGVRHIAADIRQRRAARELADRLAASATGAAPVAHTG
jgi:very-short-patch-repair endonuclease